MATNKTVTTTVQYQLNQSSVAQVQAANQTVISSLQTVEAEARNIAFQMQAAGNTAIEIFNATGVDINAKLVAPMQAASAATQNLIRDIGDLGKDIQNIPEPPMSAFGLAEDTSGGGGGIGGLRSGLRAGGFLLGSEAGGGGLRAAGQIVTLGSAFGVVGIAAGVAALALREATAAEEARAKAAQESADRLNAIAGEAAGGATTESITRQITQQQSQKEVLQEVQNQLVLYNSELQVAKNQLAAGTTSQQEYNAVTKSLGKSVDEVTGGAVTAAGGMLDLGKLLDDNQKSIDTVNIKIGGLNLELTTTAVQANNAAERLKVFSAAQIARAHDNVDAMNMTAAERQKETDSISAHITALQEFAQSNSLTSITTAELDDEVQRLEDRLKEITGVTHSWADTLADIEQRSTAVDNLFDAITKQDEAEQKLADARQAITDSLQQHADDLRQMELDEQDKEAADRQKAAQQAEDDQAKHLQKLADIDKQYAEDHEAAVGNRDALANYKAAQKRDDDTTKENAAFTLQQQQLAAHLAETLAADQAAFQKQEAQSNRHYAEQYRQLVRAEQNAEVEASRAAGLALAYQRQANDVQLNERIRANNAVATVNAVANNQAINAEVQHQMNMASIAYYGAATIETAFVGLVQRLLSVVQNAGSNPFAGAVASGSNPNPFAGAQASADQYVRGIVNNQIARLTYSAMR